MGKSSLSDNVERKSVKEKDGHFTAQGQCARCTVADCGPIAVCGSRPAFVDLRGTLSGACALSQCFHAPLGGGERRYRRKLSKCAVHGRDHVSYKHTLFFATNNKHPDVYFSFSRYLEILDVYNIEQNICFCHFCTLKNKYV